MPALRPRGCSERQGRGAAAEAAAAVSQDALNLFAVVWDAGSGAFQHIGSDAVWEQVATPS